MDAALSQKWIFIKFKINILVINLKCRVAFILTSSATESKPLLATSIVRTLSEWLLDSIPAGLLSGFKASSLITLASADW